jgi:hypothetical protein
VRRILVCERRAGQERDSSSVTEEEEDSIATAPRWEGVDGIRIRKEPEEEARRRRRRTSRTGPAGLRI